MLAPLFRFVCLPAAISAAPDGWAAEMLSDGHISLLPGEGGLAEVSAVAHSLDAATVAVVRSETDPAEQERTVITHAAALPLVWVAGTFSPAVQTWAHERGPMTLLVEAAGPLPEAERRRIERFVALLGRQAE